MSASDNSCTSERRRVRSVDGKADGLEVVTTTLEDVPKRDVKDVLVLTEDRKIEWREDGRWESIMKLRGAVPGEQ